MPPSEEKKKRKGGGGRNGVDQYTGAEIIICKLCDGKLPGQLCPSCRQKNLHPLPPARDLILVGSPPVQGKIFERERSEWRPFQTDHKRQLLMVSFGT